jgi:hypothetical protein
MNLQNANQEENIMFYEWKTDKSDKNLNLQPKEKVKHVVLTVMKEGST